MGSEGGGGGGGRHKDNNNDEDQNEGGRNVPGTFLSDASPNTLADGA